MAAFLYVVLFVCLHQCFHFHAIHFYMVIDGDHKALTAIDHLCLNLAGTFRINLDADVRCFDLKLFRIGQVGSLQGGLLADGFIVAGAEGGQLFIVMPLSSRMRCTSGLVKVRGSGAPFVSATSREIFS